MSTLSRVPAPPVRRQNLLLIGYLHLAVGGSLAIDAPTIVVDTDAFILHEFMPAWLRAALWLAAGAVIVVSVLGNRERIGWTIAAVLPFERAIGFAVSGLMWIVPGPPPGAVSSLLGAAVWIIVTKVILNMGKAVEVLPPEAGKAA